MPWRQLIATCSLALVLLAAGAASSRAAEDDEYYEMMKVFVDTFEQIDRNYVKDVDRREILEAAITGMLTKLDPYSSYIDPKELSRFNQQVEQEFGGIGIQVTVDPETRQLTVMTPLPGTPAYRAGIRAGDRIMEVADKPTSQFPKGRELETAVQLLQGKPGEKITLGVIHEGEKTIEKITVERAIIRVPTVLGDRYEKDGTWDFMLDDEKKIGYIRLTHFSRNSTRELEQTLKALKAQGMRALVLDLRFNPGGLLTAATEISDLFVDEGTIVSTRGRNTEEQVWPAKKPGTYNGFPMAVLVNKYSASASEIVSACLQDHGRAVVVGERTWGKGSVQNVIELEGGKSALKLTTAGYHRPSGKNIHRFPGADESEEWGVMPDEGYEVKLSDRATRDLNDYRADRDVLRAGEPSHSSFVDKQLVAALEYLRTELGEPSKQAGKDAPEGRKDDKAAPSADAAKPENADQSAVAPPSAGPR